MQRLQLKVKEFINVERDLRDKLKEAELKDQNLVLKLEEALCFGKMIFVRKPIIKKSLA
jgi:hypothetical protein